MMAPAWHAPAGGSAGPFPVPAPFGAFADVFRDLQREADLVQAVYMRERRSLEVLATDLAAEVRRLRAEAPPRAAAAAAPHAAAALAGAGQVPRAATAADHAVGAAAGRGGGGCAWRRQVQWRIDGLRDLAAEDGAVACSSSQDFRLSECPGVRFGLAIAIPRCGAAGPRPCAEAPAAGGAAQAVPPAAPAGAVGWRLTLEAAGGPAVRGLRLGVRLEVQLEAGAPVLSPSSASSSSTASSVAALAAARGDLLLAPSASDGGIADGDMRGSGDLPCRAEFVCEGERPQGSWGDSGALLCAVDIEMLGWEAEGVEPVGDWVFLAQAADGWGANGDGPR